MFPIVSVDIRPLELRNIDGETMAPARELGVGFEEAREPCTQIPKRPGRGRVLIEICKDKWVKTLGAEQGIKGWEVLGYRANQTEPILAIVDLKALEGGEPVVGTYVASRDRPDRRAVIGGIPHLEVGS
jgi:hypothetical protein